MVFLVVNNGLITYSTMDEWISGWWFQTFGLFFHHVWDVILPIDKYIYIYFFQRGRYTTNQIPSGNLT